MKGYKGFKKGLICLDKQYKEKTVFEEKNAKICECGMHFCTNPLNVLAYYPLVNEDGEISEYTEVEALDECKTNDGKKFCTTQLYIGKKFNISELIKNNFSLLTQTDERIGYVELNFNAMYNLFVYNNIIININDNKRINNSKENLQIFNSGRNSQIYNNSFGVQIDNAGLNAKIINNNSFTRISNIGSNGYIINNGNDNDIRNAGEYTKITNTGNGNTIVNSGNYVVVNNTGDNVFITSTGEQCIIFISGYNCKFKVKKGTWIIFTGYIHEENKENFHPFTVYIDGIKIKDNVFYEYSDGGVQKVG